MTLCCTRGNDSYLCLQPCTLALALDMPWDYDHSRMALPGLLPLVHPSLYFQILDPSTSRLFETPALAFPTSPPPHHPKSQQNPQAFALIPQQMWHLCFAPGLASLPSPAALLQALPFAILSNCIKTDKVQRDKWWTLSITFRFPSGRKPFIQTCLERAPGCAGRQRGVQGPGLTRPSTSTKSDRKRPLSLPCRANGTNGRRKVWCTLAYPPKYAGQ